MLIEPRNKRKLMEFMADVSEPSWWVITPITTVYDTSNYSINEGSEQT
jgi:hypothetical protein